MDSHVFYKVIPYVPSPQTRTFRSRIAPRVSMLSVTGHTNELTQSFFIIISEQNHHFEFFDFNRTYSCFIQRYAPHSEIYLLLPLLYGSCYICIPEIVTLINFCCPDYYCFVCHNCYLHTIRFWLWYFFCYLTLLPKQQLHQQPYHRKHHLHQKSS